MFEQVHQVRGVDEEIHPSEGIVIGG